MRRFLKNLFSNTRTTSKASAGKPSTRRAVLQMEGLEDRTVPTVVNFASPGTLNIYDVEPGHTVTIESNNKTQIEVLDNGTAAKGHNPVNKESISLVHIELDAEEHVTINGSGNGVR